MSASAFSVLRRRDLLLVALVLYLVTAITAGVTGLLFAGQARAILAVHFQRLPCTIGQAAGIWLHNLRSTLGVGVFAVLDPTSRWLLQGACPWWRRLLLGLCDLLLAGWALGSATAAGVLLGAYGTRQLKAFLPDGPVEVMAWLLLIVLYLDVRRGRASPRAAAARLAVIAVLLAAAAALELKAGS